jgi:hypothetical protein
MCSQSFIENSLRFRRNLRRFILGWLSPKTLESEEERESVNKILKEHWAPQPIKAYELLFEEWDTEEDPKSEKKRRTKDSFIVFIDFEFDVDWLTEKKCDSSSAKCISAAEAIGARRCKHLPIAQILELKRLVGHAIICGIRNDADECSKLAATAAQFLKDRTTERSRYWTLISAHIVVLLLFIILIGIFQMPWLQPDEHLSWKSLLWSSTLGGLLGAYLSIIQNAGSGQWDAAAGISLHALEVLTKLLTGVLFGGIAFSIASSVQAPSALKELVSDNCSMFIFGLAAGFIERLVPKMVSSYSEIALGENK